MNTLTRGRRILFGCITSALSVLVAFTTVEIYVRVTRPHKDLYQLTGRIAGPNPMSEWAVVDAFCAYRPKAGQYATNKTVNSHGFFSTPEITAEKPEGTVRIVFLGESSTAGTGQNLADAETWPWQTIEMIRREVPQKIDFINAAVGGYSSFESYGRLWSRIRHFSPDIVVVCHGWNEMYYFEKADRIPSWRTLPDGSWSLESTSKPISVYAPLWIDPIIRRSQALTRIRIRTSRRISGEVGASRDGPFKTDYNHSGVSIWRTNVRLIRDACHIFGAKLFVAKQATLIVPGLPQDQRKRCRYDYHGFDHDAHVKAFEEIYRIIDEEIPADSIIDLTPLSGRPECFFDHIHPTPLGCTKIASTVSKSLVPYIQQMKSGQPATSPYSEPAARAPQR